VLVKLTCEFAGTGLLAAGCGAASAPAGPIVENRKTVKIVTQVMLHNTLLGLFFMMVYFQSWFKNIGFIH
jgi:hypothetical protein